MTGGPATETLATGDPASGRRVLARRVGAVLGVVLVIGAVAWIVSRDGALDGVRDALASPRPVDLGLLVGSVVANLVLTGIFFRELYRRSALVPAREMVAVMAAATLVNYLPLRPGLAARIAYLRRVHGITVGRSVRVMVEAMATSVVLAIALVGVAWIGRGQPSAVPIGAAAIAVVAGAVAVAVPRGRTGAILILVRLAEVGCIAVRTWAAFRLVGHDISVAAAVGLAAVAVVATLVPFTSNGLGLREWAVALLAPTLAGVALEPSMAAELVARVAEVVVAIALGGPALAWLSRRAAAGRADASVVPVVAEAPTAVESPTAAESPTAVESPTAADADAGEADPSVTRPARSPDPRP